VPQIDDELRRVLREHRYQVSAIRKPRTGVGS
jgi:hypothetical protein